MADIDLQEKPMHLGERLAREQGFVSPAERRSPLESPSPLQTTTQQEQLPLEPSPPPEWLENIVLPNEPLAGRSERLLQQAERNAAEAQFEKIAQRIKNQEGLEAVRRLQTRINQLRNGLRRNEPVVQQLHEASPTRKELDELLGVPHNPDEPKWNDQKWADIPPAEAPQE